MYVTGKDSLLQIGDGSTVTGNSYGATGAALASSSGGKIEIGNGVTIGHDNIRGYDVNSIAVLSMDGNASQGQSNITIGDDSTIYAKGKGYGANAVQAGYLSYTGFNGVGTKQGSSGQISVGDKATIWTEGDESFAVYGIHADSTLYVGKDAEISTQGDKASAVRGGNITKVYDFTAAGGKITIDEGAEIKTLGDQSHGVDARYDGTLIELKKDAVITTVGSESHGITALAGGTVILQDAAVTVDSTKDAYAFSAEGKDSDTAAVSTITGSGVYNIVGDIRAADGGILTLDLAEGSRFEGKAVLDSGNDSQSTLTMAKNSLWTLTGNSQLNSLQNEQSVIDMTGDNKAFSTLSVETLTGNGGTIIMDIDGSQVDASDKIYVTGDFSGSQTLSLKEINGLDSDPGIGQAAENTVLASVNGSGTFTADDQEGTLYWQRYELGQKDSAASGYTTDWYLKGITNLNLPTTSVEAIAASGALAYHTWRDHDQLLQRLGDLRQHGREEEGVWVRVKGGKLSRSDQFEFENKYTQYELGYDQKLKSFLRSKNCVGVGILNEYSAKDLKTFQYHILLFPDFADLSAPATNYPLLQKLKEKAKGRKVISLLGSINFRKGIKLLLESIPLLPKDEYFFLIAGKSSLTAQQENDLRAFGESRNNCLFSLEKIPDESCFNALIAESDLIFAAYKQFTGSSNHNKKATSNRTPK